MDSQQAWLASAASNLLAGRAEDITAALATPDNAAAARAFLNSRCERLVLTRHADSTITASSRPVPVGTAVRGVAFVNASLAELEADNMSEHVSVSSLHQHPVQSLFNLIHHVYQPLLAASDDSSALASSSHELLQQLDAALNAILRQKRARAGVDSVDGIATPLDEVRMLCVHMQPFVACSRTCKSRFTPVNPKLRWRVGADVP